MSTCEKWNKKVPHGLQFHKILLGTDKIDNLNVHPTLQKTISQNFSAQTHKTTKGIEKYKEAIVASIQFTYLFIYSETYTIIAPW